MTPFAYTPGELDVLLEDASVLGDLASLCALYDEQALLVDAAGRTIRGAEAIADVLGAMRFSEGAYIARSAHTVRNGDDALVVARGGAHVLQRRNARDWRVTISLLDPTNRMEER